MRLAHVGVVTRLPCLQCVVVCSVILWLVTFRNLSSLAHVQSLLQALFLVHTLSS
jgi:hypothetical protein